jgi:DNA modification methylase
MTNTMTLNPHPDATILVGDVRQRLADVPSESVRTCVTSPPYFGLRDYGVEGQIGLEQTPDEYVAELVAVFREVRRTLTDNGTLWLNLGDSYAAQRGGTEMPAETLAGGVGGVSKNFDAYRGRGFSAKMLEGQESAPSRNAPVAHRNARAFGLKHKDLIGAPWRVAFALQADGWYLRQDIIWHKPNPMPESVRDRCTKAHEYVFLLSKSERYYFNTEAMQEPSEGGGRRNKRSVWTVPTRPFREAHFATFPMELIAPCVLAGSAVGDVVLDPFNGSGTTGIVATNNDRRYVGIELNPEYAEISRKRFVPQMRMTL